MGLSLQVADQQSEGYPVRMACGRGQATISSSPMELRTRPGTTSVLYRALESMVLQEGHLSRREGSSSSSLI